MESYSNEYYDGINQGDDYMCDRCEIVKLSYNEYTNNVREIFNSGETMRYCDECRNYIILKKWNCNTCNTSGTMRNERLVPKVCCGQEVIWS